MLLTGPVLTLRTVNVFLRRAVRARFLVEEETPTVCNDLMKMNVRVPAASRDGGEVVCLRITSSWSSGGECCKSRNDCSPDEHLGGSSEDYLMRWKGEKYLKML